MSIASCHVPIWSLEILECGQINCSHWSFCDNPIFAFGKPWGRFFFKITGNISFWSLHPLNCHPLNSISEQFHKILGPRPSNSLFFREKMWSVNKFEQFSECGLYTYIFLSRSCPEISFVTISYVWSSFLDIRDVLYDKHGT